MLEFDAEDSRRGMRMYFRLLTGAKRRYEKPRVARVSAFSGGSVGTPEQREDLYRLVLDHHAGEIVWYLRIAREEDIRES